MSLKKFRAFISAMECGSLSKAGERENCTQSAITHLILDFEKDLGFKVMKRTKSGVFLTDEGKKLYPIIKEVINADDRVNETIKKIRGEKSNLIRIATFTSVAVNWLPAIMKGFKELHSDIQFEIVDGGYYDITSALEGATVDIGFVAMPLDSNCYCEPIYSDRLLAVVPNGKFNEYERLPVKYFESEPVISLSESTDQDYRRTFVEAGITPNVKYRTKDDYAMVSMVESGLGICLVPELLLKGMKTSANVLEIDPPAKRIIGLALSYENATTLVKEFYSYIKSWVKENTNK